MTSTMATGQPSLVLTILLVSVVVVAVNGQPGRGPPVNGQPGRGPPINLPPPVPKKCLDKAFPDCYQVQMLCPTTCPHNCFIDCNKCAPVCSCDVPGAICQDPRFIGADGVTFYFHGKKDQDFCLVTDADLHINAHFIGKRSPTMTRDFTWIQSIGVMFGDHKLFLGAEETSTWDDSVDRTSISLDGKQVHIPHQQGSTWESFDLVEPRVLITRLADTNELTIEVEGNVKITAKVVPITEEESTVHNYGITSDDCFAHLEIGFKFLSLTSDVDGVLGQTYRDDYVSRVKTTSAMPVMRGEPKYATSSLFSTDCAVGRFGRNGSDLILVKPHMVCESRLGGPGMVCKR